MKSIKFKHAKFDVKFTLRALLMYEEMEQKPFDPKTFTDQLKFIYCVLVCSNDYTDLTWEGFVDGLSEEFSIEELRDWMVNIQSQSDHVKKN